MPAVHSPRPFWKTPLRPWAFLVCSFVRGGFVPCGKLGSFRPDGGMYLQRQRSHSRELRTHWQYALGQGAVEWRDPCNGTKTTGAVPWCAWRRFGGRLRQAVGGPCGPARDVGMSEVQLLGDRAPLSSRPAFVQVPLRAGFVIFPARMHEVQMLIRRGAPSTRTRTLWMFGFQRRFVRRWEWLRFIPNDGCLPHTSHTAATTRSPLDGNSSGRDLRMGAEPRLFQDRMSRLAS